MNRRDLIKNVGIAGIAATLPSTFGFAHSSPNYQNAGFFEFTVGALELLVVTDGHSVFKPVQPMFAPGIAPEAIKQVLTDNFQPADSLDLAFNILVIKKDKRIILVDTGCGHLFGSASGKLPANLFAAGIKTTDITDIILTHAHSDHLGGLLTQDSQSVFPNANIFISVVEHDFWMSLNPDFSRSKSDKAIVNSLIKQAKHTLTSLKKRLHFFKDGDTLFNCIKVQLAPGHTPGHTIAHIFSENEELVHIADTVHTHVLLLAHPEWGVSFDTDFHNAVTTRTKTLQSLSEQRSRVFSYHLPWPGLGHVRKKDEGYEWVQEAFSTPQLYQK